MGDSMMRRLTIEFDRKNETYMPGEVISGKILAEFTQPIPVRRLRVEVRGESAVRWFPKKYQPESEYQRINETSIFAMTGHEEYFTSKFYLLGDDCSPLFMLPAGQFSYPFQYELPCNLPSSFEHHNGYVRYTIKAIFDRHWERDSEVKSMFTVISTCDLNRISDAAQPIRADIVKDFFCSCIYPTGRIFARLSVPTTGFVPGEMIPIVVRCENESTVDVTSIKVSLWRKLQFYAKIPHWSYKLEESIVAETRRVAPFRNSIAEVVTMQLKVPQLQSTGLKHCALIDVDYTLRIVMCFSGMHFSVKREFPILIGTVPLSNSINAQQLNAESLPYIIRTPSVWNPKILPPPSYDESFYGGRSIGNKTEFALGLMMHSR